MYLVEIAGILVNPEHIVFVEYNEYQYHDRVTAFIHLTTGKHIKLVFHSIDAFKAMIKDLRPPKKTGLFEMLYNCLITILKPKVKGDDDA